VRARAELTIRARAERVAALYLDWARWPQLFPATIRAVRLLRQSAGEIVVEVDHRTAGPVVNVVRPLSPTVIALDERKPRYDATLVNRFKPEGEGTRYTVDAVVRLRLPYGLLAPFLSGLVRRRLRRFVLEPMGDAAGRAAGAAGAAGV